MRVRHGCYAFADAWRALSDEDRHVLVGRAAVRRIPGVALSHATSALAHGMAVWDVDPARAHVTRTDAGRVLGRVDFAWPEHRLIVEFDGRAKYQRHLRPGESPADAVVREKLREDTLRARGWTVIRMGWADPPPGQ